MCYEAVPHQSPLSALTPHMCLQVSSNLGPRQGGESICLYIYILYIYTYITYILYIYDIYICIYIYIYMYVCTVHICVCVYIHIYFLYIYNPETVYIYINIYMCTVYIYITKYIYIYIIGKDYAATLPLRATCSSRFKPLFNWFMLVGRAIRCAHMVQHDLPALQAALIRTV